MPCRNRCPQAESSILIARPLEQTMDDQSAVRDMLLDDLLRDILSQHESLKMISQLCTDTKIRRLLHTVISAQAHSADKILKQLDQKES